MLITLHLTSLGCAKNLVDSEVMAARLVGEGVRIVEDPAGADVLLVNTCTFIEDATSESVDTILELGRLRTEGRCQRLVVVGCLAQRYGEQLGELLPEVDVFVGTGGLAKAVDACLGRDTRTLHLPDPDQAPLAGHERAVLDRGPSAYLKIAEGCSQACSFCIIPALRGPLRSRTIDDVVREARALARTGVREINLLAQDTTAFGRDRPGNERLSDLLIALDGVEELAWIRLLYAYPARFGDQLIRAIALTERVCPYVDVPLQHVDDRVLRGMGRGTSESTVRGLVERLRGGIDDLALRTTLLVGFPGETDQAFQNLMDFVAEVRFERLGAFAFSQEEGTPAAAMPDQVPVEVRTERLEALLALQSTILGENARASVGQVRPVLVEGLTEGPLLVGRTRRQAPEVDGQVIVDGAEAEPGTIVPVRITGVDGADRVGEVVLEGEPGDYSGR